MIEKGNGEVEFDILATLFQEWAGVKPETITLLKGAGSNRRYFRLTAGERSAIGVHGESEQEDKAFVSLARHFTSKNLPTPTVYAATDDCHYYIQEDLGDLSLYDYLKPNIGSEFTASQWKALVDAIQCLPRLQFLGAQGLDWNVCYPQPAFDYNTVMWDLNYFKYCFLKATGVSFLETKLEEDFKRMVDALLQSATDTFLYRDFQSRNVMLHTTEDGELEPVFIDFQGGRKGPIFYDVASFVFQSRLRLNAQQRDALIDAYLQALQPYESVSSSEFKAQLMRFVFFRTLQTLGAYGFRGYFERKSLFLQSIPPAISLVRELLDQGVASSFPYLQSLLRQVCALPKFQSVPFYASDGTLTVEVFSFSYKKGVPDDFSGNGGGYVFDCRGMHNPGRYDEYKTLTGRDKPVIDYLEQQGEVQRFLASVYALADPHVERYIKRGFSHLQFAFGCTGGQHRSVYCAQHLAEHLHAQFPTIRIMLCHRERGISQVI